MKKLLIVASISLLVISNLYLLGQLRADQDVPDFIQAKSSDESLLSYQSGFEVMLQNDGISLAGKTLYDVYVGTEVAVSDLFKDSTDLYLVMRYNQLDCEACVEFAYSKLVEHGLDVNGIEVLVMKDKSTILNQHAPDIPAGEDNFKRMDYINMTLPIDAACVPHYFILDKNMVVHDMFVPDRMNQEITDKYLEMVVDKWSSR